MKIGGRRDEIASMADRAAETLGSLGTTVALSVITVAVMALIGIALGAMALSELGARGQ